MNPFTALTSEDLKHLARALPYEIEDDYRAVDAYSMVKEALEERGITVLTKFEDGEYIAIFRYKDFSDVPY